MQDKATDVPFVMLRPWELASAAFFAYDAIVAFLPRRLPAASRWRVATACAAGLALTALSAILPAHPIVHDWLMPPVLLLIAYWTSGALFVAPMPRAERVLQNVDRALGVRRWPAIAPRWIAEGLEVAYSSIYALIPVALAIHLTMSTSPDAGRFWTVILVTDFVCFGVLPWVQTRPPRALEPDDPWGATCRRLNLRLLGSTSIQVNTFPSGHAAEALAAALLVSDVSWAVFAWMLFGALAVSAGAVFGRYHYVADAVMGWLVAGLVWVALGR